MRVELDDQANRAVAFDLADLEIEAVTDERNVALVGCRVREVAAERGADPFDDFTVCVVRRTS